MDDADRDALAETVQIGFGEGVGPKEVGPGNDLMAHTQQPATLHTQGLLTDDEFATEKAKLLA
ncbi:hypothetical protein [Leifsonia sp. NPDC058230]|uniref:hypothetical protein n=1 Tax=Leifsonia sp. NPDC058230 TaxID=3346391 RepID=UPI0036D8636B